MSNTNQIGQSTQLDQGGILDDKLVLVTIAIKCFSGYRRATREDIQDMGGNLPLSEAVTEGSIKVFPNDRLNTFSTIRRGVFRKVGAMGVKALGSGNTFAIPRDVLPKLETILIDASKEFDAEVMVLQANYDTWFEEHIAANPEAGVIIRKLKIPSAVALTRYGFTSHTFKIVPIQQAGGAGAGDVTTIVEGLARQLFEEVAAEADKLLQKSDAFTKHQKAGQKTLRPIKDAALKMKGLEFLDPIVLHGIKLIEDTLSALPQSGYIEDSAFAKPFSTLKRLLEVMSDVDDLVDAAGRVGNGFPVDQVLFPPKQIIAAVAQLPQEVAPAAPVQVDLTLDVGVGMETVPMADPLVFDLPAVGQPVATVPAMAKSNPAEMLMF